MNRLLPCLALLLALACRPRPVEPEEPPLLTELRADYPPQGDSCLLRSVRYEGLRTQKDTFVVAYHYDVQNRVFRTVRFAADNRTVEEFTRFSYVGNRLVGAARFRPNPAFSSDPAQPAFLPGTVDAFAYDGRGRLTEWRWLDDLFRLQPDTDDAGRITAMRFFANGVNGTYHLGTLRYRWEGANLTGLTSVYEREGFEELRTRYAYDGKRNPFQHLPVGVTGVAQRPFPTPNATAHNPTVAEETFKFTRSGGFLVSDFEPDYSRWVEYDYNPRNFPVEARHYHHPQKFPGSLEQVVKFRYFNDGER